VNSPLPVGRKAQLNELRVWITCRLNQHGIELGKNAEYNTRRFHIPAQYVRAVHNTTKAERKEKYLNTIAYNRYTDVYVSDIDDALNQPHRSLDLHPNSESPHRRCYPNH